MTTQHNHISSAFPGAQTTPSPKVFVVEDEQITTMLIRARLMSLGYDFAGSVSTGEEAIIAVGETRPDLVLMDIMLGGSMDGVETAGMIRSRYDVPVVYLTAFADNATLQRARITEPFGYILKPFEERDLHAAIEMALYKHSHEKQLHENNQRFRSLIQNSSDVITIHDETGTIRYASDSSERILGRKPEQLVGRVPFEFIHPDDVAVAQEEFARLRVGRNTGMPTPLRFRRADGSWVCLESLGTNLLDHADVNGIVITSRDITERKRLEDHVRQSNERQALLLRSMPLAFYTASAKGEMETTWISDQVETMTGIPPKRFVESTTFWSERLHPEDRDRAVREYEAIHQKGTVANEYRWMCADGTYRWFLDLGVLVRTNDGKANEISGAWLDITELKRTEQALLESQNRLTKLNDCLLSFGPDPDENISRLVALCGEQLGATAALYNRAEGDYLLSLGHWNTPPDYNLMDKAEGHICYDVIHRKQSDACVIRNLSESTYAKTDPNVRRYGLKTYVGKAVSFADAFIGSLCVVYQHDHEPSEGDLKLLGVAAAAIGVEERRKQAEEKITMLAHTVRSIGEAVSITDLDNRIIFVNAAFLRMYGYEEQELIGKSIEVIRSPNVDAAELPAIFSSTRAGGWQGETLNRRKDGTDFPINLSTSVVFDDGGQAIALVGVAQDISQQKQLEQQVRQSQKMESMGTMVGGISHDFNNILNNILGFVYQLRKYSHDPEKVAKYTDTIEKSATRGAELASQLLSVVRHKKREDEQVNINALIDEIAALIRETFPKSVVVETTVPSQTLAVAGNQGELFQAVLNLCLNARDAMPEGGKLSIEVTADEIREAIRNAVLVSASSPGQACVKIQIRDSGSGIPKPILDKIFDPLFTTKDRGKGTGLGLSVVYTIVKNHKGTMAVDTEEGRGSAFTIYLPAVEASKTERAGEELAVPSMLAHGYVLLVDDEESMRELGRELLEDQGYKVIVAHDGLEAVQIYRELWKEIALVVLDLVMPKLDGGMAFLEMKKINPGIKAFFCTGYSSDQMISSLLSEEKLLALQKPFRPIDLTKMVNEVLSM